MKTNPVSDRGGITLQFCLLPAGLDPATVRQSLPPEALTIPAGVSFLALDSEPRLGSGSPPVAGGEAIVFEPIAFKSRQPSLLMLAPSASMVRLNGLAAPRIAVLRERDQLELPAGARFHVAVRQGPSVGPPSAAQLGCKCPLCLQPLVAGTRIYTCACGTTLHAEPDQPAGNPLQCVELVTACPACEKPIVRTEGWSWLPENAHA